MYGSSYGISPAYGFGYGYNYQTQNGIQQSSLTRVTGLEGAKAYQMAANSVAALFDASEDVMYIKSTDGAGFPTIRVFEFFERKEAPAAVPAEEYVSRKEFDELKTEVQKYGEQFVRKFGNGERREHHADGQPVQPVQAEYDT